MVESLSPSEAESRGTAKVLAALRSHLLDLSPGDLLPSVRSLCAELEASPNTVQRAIAALAREGVVDTIPGKGSFVRHRAAPSPNVDLSWQALALGARPPRGEDMDLLVAPVPEGAISLRAGYPDEELQPLAALQAALGRSSRRPGVWGRQPVEGNPELRAWFAREAAPGSGSGEALIVPGGQSALTLLFRTLCPPGAPLLLESPTYTGATAIARASGILPVPIPTDEQGVLPDALAAAFRSTGARVFYCQPTFANPSGTVLSLERRLAVLEAAASASAFVVEDDYAHDLALEGSVPERLVSLDPGRVIYVRSLTKSAAPGLRIAAIVARGPVAARLRAARAVDDLFVSGPLQEAALEVVTSPAWPRHLGGLQSALRHRRDALVDGLRTYWPAARLTRVPKGGFHLWLQLPSGMEERQVVADAQSLGVYTSPGSIWFPAEPTGAFLRLSFAGASAEALREAARRLGGL